MTVDENVNRVLIIESGSVLDEGIKSLVRGRPELQVSSLIYADPPTTLKKVMNALPDVIVMSEAGAVGWARISEILHRLSREQPVRMIVVRPDDNILEVYDKQCITTTRNEDLIILISHRQR